ncbi:hypothetical protein LINGRAHAP2_LOCUS12509 [Linum grandiflorum]
MAVLSRHLLRTWGAALLLELKCEPFVDELQLAWNLGTRRIRVQSDSMAAIAILVKDSEPDHQHAALVLQFKELSSRHQGSPSLPLLPRGKLYCGLFGQSWSLFPLRHAYF